jgi:hypothetical protein
MDVLFRTYNHYLGMLFSVKFIFLYAFNKQKYKYIENCNFNIPLNRDEICLLRFVYLTTLEKYNILYSGCFSNSLHP